MNNLFLTLALVLGDSHAQGFPGEVLSKHLNERGYTVARATKVGATVYEVTKHPFNLKGATLKFMFLGSNDSPGKNTVKRYQKLKQLYPGVYMIGPPFFQNKKLDQRSYEISKIQKQIFGIKYLDSRVCTTNNSERYPDGVHFTYYGAANWVNCVLKQVK